MELFDPRWLGHLGLIRVLFQLCERLVVSVIYHFEKLLSGEVVFDLLLAVEVDSMVVSGELVSLEELDSCLVQLDDHDLV